MQPVTSTTTTGTTRTTATAIPFRKAHPIRGILWGFLMGLGATVIAVLLKIIPLDLVWAVIVLAGGIVVGILWSTLGPAKKPKGTPPRPSEPVTHRPDWDSASPVPPAAPTQSTEPTPPGSEPLNIRPLDVEPLDIASPESADDVSDPQPGRDDPFPDPVPRAHDTMDPPDRSVPPPPPPPPPPR